MPGRRSLAQAISAIIAAGGPTVGVAQEQAGGLDEIIVTARKREENLQDIPLSVQAFTADDIQRYGFKGVADYARFIPSLKYVSSSPGQTKLIFRGVADSASPFIADASAAIYLDEQPLTQGAQAPEVRLVDIERIEALSGPQATLYGASSQSGTLRILTNRPDPAEFYASLSAMGADTKDGEASYDFDGTVNIPIVKDILAVRLVGFHGRDGGYIDNVLGQNPDKDAAGDPIFGARTNAAAVEKDINSVDWVGARASVRWNVNDAWAATAMYNYQRSDATGWNDFDPTVGDLETVKFFSESRDDEWHQLSLAIEGDLGFAQLISSTSYFTRGIEYSSDLTFYNAYLNTPSAYDPVAYPQYNIYDFGLEPSGFDTNRERHQRLTQEIRLSHEGSRWDWTLGFFYQDAKQKWDYKIFHRDYVNSDALEAWRAFYGVAIPDTNIGWHSNETNTRDDLAVFGEVTFHAFEKLDLIFGGRWYDVDIDRVYSQWHPDGYLEDRVTPSGSDSGFLPKGAIQYTFGEDKMVYALYSQGYRTGGINRSRGQPTLPFEYDPDLLINYEAGAKTQWLDGRVQVNLTGYHMLWKDFQLEVTDPSYQFGEPFQTVITNVGDAVQDGIDFDITAIPYEGWEVGFNGTWLLKHETKDQLLVFDPRDPASPVLDVAEGQELPLSPDFSASAYVEYGWTIEAFDADAFLRFQYSYTGDSLNFLEPSPEPFPQLVQKDYHIGDIRAGVGRGSWEAELFVNNLWDERPEIYRDVGGAERYWAHDNIITAQPRSFGLRIRKHFK
jgi:outer membrane receptor protein involved in Fe transport